MLINIKTRHFHSSINHREHLLHSTFITGYFRPVNIAIILRTVFFIEHLQKQSFTGIPHNRVTPLFLNVSQTSQESTCVESLFKKLAGWMLATSLKKTPTQVFSCEVGEIFKNNFSYRTPQVTASALPAAASVFFFKEVLFNSYFATLLWRTKIFSSRLIVWCIKSRTRVFINLLSIVRFSK